MVVLSTEGVIMAKQRKHGLFGRLIAEALNVPEEDVEQALATMRDNCSLNPTSL